METLVLTFSGDTPTAVAVTALTRVDNGTTVPGVDLPAAMTFSGGSWVLDFAPPADGLTYAYTFTATWADGTTTTADATHVGAGTSAGTYATRTDIDDLYGVDNVTEWADLNSNNDAREIADRVDRARAGAYRWINSKLRGARLTAPATAGNFAEFDLLADVEAERAGAWLYFSRGKDQQQGTDSADGSMQWHFDHAEKELDRIIANVQIEDADDATNPPGTFDSVPLRYGPAASCDEFWGY